MKKDFLGFFGAMVLGCSAAFAVAVSPGEKSFTITNTSVNTPFFETQAETIGYSITPGLNNTGTICVGSSAINATNCGLVLSAGDSESKGQSGVTYRLDKLYFRGSAVNDTVNIKYDVVE